VRGAARLDEHCAALAPAAAGIAHAQLDKAGDGPACFADGVENIRHASETTGVYGADSGAEQCGGGHHNIFTADYGCKFHDFAFLYRKVTGGAGHKNCPSVLISAKAMLLSHICLDVVDNREISFVFALLRVVSGGVDDVVTPG